MKLYNRIFILVLAFIALVGFFLPYLLSAKSNELVLGGLAIIIGIVYYSGKCLLEKGDK